MNSNIPELDSAGLRRFALIMGGSVAVMFGIVLPLLISRTMHWWPWMAAAIIVLWSALWPTTLRPLYVAWMKGAAVLGKVSNAVLLSLFFIFVLSPMGLIMRFLGYDPLQGKCGDKAGYRIKSSGVSIKQQMEKPY